MANGEQDTNSHDVAVANIEKMFGGGEEEKETPETEEPVEQTAEAEGEDQEEVQAQPEEVEVEIDGETYLVPKKISERFIQQADYTRKTRDLAEMRRALSAEREVMALDQAFQKSVSDESKQLSQVEAALEQFKQIDWSQLDTEQMIRLGRQREQLREQRSDLQEAVKAKRAEVEGRMKAAQTQAMQAGETYVKQKVPGFDDSKKQALFAYGLNEGYTRDELDRLVDPRIVVTMWKASQWDALQESKPRITNKAAKAQPVVRPGSTQKPPSKAQVLRAKISKAQGQDGARQAAEDYLTARFGG